MAHILTRERRAGSMGSAMAWLGGAYGVALAGYLAVNVLAARLLGPGRYASFLVLTTVAFVIGQLSLFGAHRAGLREVARLDRSDRAGLAAIGREGAAIVCVAVPTVALATSAVFILAAGTQVDGQRLALGLELGGLVVVNAIQKLGANYLRGLGRLAAASIIDGSAGGALALSVQACLLGALLLSGGAPSLVAVVAVSAVGYLPSMVVLAVLLKPFWPGLQTRHLLAPLGQVIRHSRVFAVIQVVGYASASLEIWLAALTLHAVDASYFGAAQRLALMFAVPLTALQSVASPAISRMAMTSDRRLLERALRTSASVALLGAGVLAVPVLLAPGRTLSIFFGTGRAGFAAVLVFLVIGQLVNVATGMCGPVLTMTRFEGTVAGATTLGLVLRVGLGVPSALIAGAIGLALTSTIVSTAVWLWLVVRARTLCAINTLPATRPHLGALRAVRG